LCDPHGSAPKNVKIRQHTHVFSYLTRTTIDRLVFGVVGETFNTTTVPIPAQFALSRHAIGITGLGTGRLLVSVNAECSTCLSDGMEDLFLFIKKQIRLGAVMTQLTDVELP